MQMLWIWTILKFCSLIKTEPTIEILDTSKFGILQMKNSASEKVKTIWEKEKKCWLSRILHF